MKSNPMQFDVPDDLEFMTDIIDQESKDQADQEFADIEGITLDQYQTDQVRMRAKFYEHQQ